MLFWNEKLYWISRPFRKNIKSLGVESQKFDGKWSTLKYHWCAKLTDDSKTLKQRRFVKTIENL